MVASTGALTDRAWPREAVLMTRKPGASPGDSGRARTGLLDAGLLLALPFVIPFVILLVGSPLALVIALLLWLAGMR